MVVVVVLFWIFKTKFVLVCPARHSRAPADPPRPRDRATPAPYSSSGSRRRHNGGTETKLGERGAVKVCLLGMANNRYILFWLSGRAIDSVSTGQGFKPRLQVLSSLFVFE